MKNLDVDTVSTYFRAYDACQVRIEFTGGYPIGKSQGNNPCQVTVPYCSFSKKLQTIQRLGGKIVSVSILEGKLASAHTSSTVVETEAIAPEPELVIEPEAIAPEPEPIVESEAIAPEPEPIVESEAIAPEPEPVIKTEAIAPEPEPIVETEAITPEPKSVVEIEAITPEPKSVVEIEAIAPEPVVEIEAIAPEPEPVIEIEAIAPEKISKKSTTKPKKPKSASKANHGFNKPSKIATETMVAPIANIGLDESVEPIPQKEEAPDAIAIESVISETPVKETIVETITERIAEPIVNIASEEIIAEPLVEVITEPEIIAEPLVEAEPVAKIVETEPEIIAEEIIAEPVVEAVSEPEIIAEPLVEAVSEPEIIAEEIIAEPVVEAVSEPENISESEKTPEPVAEIAVAQSLEPIPDVHKPTSPAVDLPEAIASLPKSNKAKTSTKSAKGFNKPKDGSKTTKKTKG
jgi:hypothetical protein